LTWDGLGGTEPASARTKRALGLRSFAAVDATEPVGEARVLGGTWSGRDGQSINGQSSVLGCEMARSPGCERVLKTWWLARHSCPPCAVTSAARCTRVDLVVTPIRDEHPPRCERLFAVLGAKFLVRDYRRTTLLGTGSLEELREAASRHPELKIRLASQLGTDRRLIAAMDDSSGEIIVTIVRPGLWMAQEPQGRAHRPEFYKPPRQPADLADSQ
jgi:hypothetical protein